MSNSDSILGRVSSIVADIFTVPVEQVTPLSSPDTIENWDSLGHLNLILALEQTFETQFSPEQVERMLNVKAIVEELSVKAEETREEDGVL